MEDRGVYLVLGFTDEGSSFEYTEKRAEDVEKRLIPLLKDKKSPYKRFIMRVPGFGSNKTMKVDCIEFQIFNLPFIGYRRTHVEDYSVFVKGLQEICT